MGQFSWITQDTNRSISNLDGSQFRVIMTDDKGNRWVEDNYEGYGEFGGKDYFVLMSEMNGFRGEHEAMRSYGIDLSCSGRGLSPSLSECGDYYNGEHPLNCPDQGWVEYDEDGNRVSDDYDEDEEDEEW